MNPLRSDLIKGYEKTIARCRRAIAYGDEVEKNVKRIEEAQSQIDILEGAYEVATEALEKQISIKEVINQLRENKINCKNSSTIYDTNDYVLLDKAIEIVKGDWRVEE